MEGRVTLPLFPLEAFRDVANRDKRIKRERDTFTINFLRNKDIHKSDASNQKERQTNNNTYELSALEIELYTMI